MRTTIVPAQITTVEDKIAGNLNITQIFLLLTPVFFGSIIYLIFPPHVHFALYKVIAIIVVLIVSGVLAIRIRGRVIVQWIAILFRYNNRPRYYIANKNDIFHRDVTYEDNPQTESMKKVEQSKITEQKKEISITFPDLFKLEQFLNHPKSKLRFTFIKKGKLYVSVSEVKQ